MFPKIGAQALQTDLRDLWLLLVVLGLLLKPLAVGSVTALGGRNKFAGQIG
jgi:hypothetical protein